ncbi:hypothetical protein AHiyo8_pI69480 (plasmid) [Arthrobacter sp. Hiyo8]|nr:hypothetical protein AHiyo8_pI69480 [Arthrobacter sp. Hiyo8]
MLVDAGAEVIVQGSTGLSSIGMTAVLRDRLGVPVIDPVTAAGSVLLSGAGADPRTRAENTTPRTECSW